MVRKSAFTLLELLVVIVIIGLLTGLATTSYISAQRTARDNTRKSAVASISTALEAFYATNRRFPGLIGNEGVGYIPTIAPDQRARWAGCLAVDTFEGKSSIVYYSFPTIIGGNGVQQPCNQRTAGTGFDPSKFGAFPNWIPEMGEFLNPAPVERRYLANNGDSTHTLDGDDGAFRTDSSDILGANLSQAFVYRRLVSGYMVYTRLESSTTDILTYPPNEMTDQPLYSDGSPNGTKPIHVYSNTVFMIRK